MPLTEIEEQLFTAVAAEDVETIKILCRKNMLGKRKVNPNCVKKNKVTPLHAACLKGLINSIETLLKHGADANSKMISGQCPPTFSFFKGRCGCH